MYDNLTYNYLPTNNKLDHIGDIAGLSAYPLDLENQATDNYTYDNDGNLTKDISENISEITWTADGKVFIVTKSDVPWSSALKARLYQIQTNQIIDTKIVRTFTHYIIYKYDGMGKRIAKLNYRPSLDVFIQLNTSTNLIAIPILRDFGSSGTYYIRDANGEVISTFKACDYFPEANFSHNEFSEWNIYGSEEHWRFAVVKY